jgi:hypothetical protein
MNVDPLECNIVKNCAATLAGLGTAGIFNADCPDPLCLENRLRELNLRLSPKGVKAEVLFFRKSTALIYVYRPERLEYCLKDPMAKDLLRRLGYEEHSVPEGLEHLKRRFSSGNQFPHEIGIFLGYPAYDVCQFIENGGRNYLYCGTWKVYSQEEKARCFFARVRKCTEIYRKALENGMSIDRLTVSVRKSW